MTLIESMREAQEARLTMLPSNTFVGTYWIYDVSRAYLDQYGHTGFTEDGMVINMEKWLCS